MSKIITITIALDLVEDGILSLNDPVTKYIPEFENLKVAVSEDGNVLSEIKIDDPALQHALKKKFYYIGALGSKKTHENRCQRLKEAGFSQEQINSIHGPIGIKLGGKSAPEIALSIIAQLVSEVYNKSEKK